MHAEIGASLGRLLGSLNRTMAVSDAWLSRSLREAVRDKGASHGPTVPVDIYAFAKFKNACFFPPINADEVWC